jgi:signal recognition particle subunit SRP54
VFEALGNRLQGVFDRLRGRGALSEADVSDALREVRVALLEADVALPVVRDIIAKVREGAVGQEVIRSIQPGQQVVKIVHDALVEALGGGDEGPRGLDLNAPAPMPILMVGLQGSGKTTTSGKIALRLRTRERKKVLLASLDVHRPAAQLQLAQLAERAEVVSLPIIAGSRRSRSPSAPWIWAGASFTTSSSSTPPAASRSTMR